MRPESCLEMEQLFNPTSAKPELSWPPWKARSIHQPHHQGLPVWGLLLPLQLVMQSPDNLCSASWYKGDAGRASTKAGKCNVHLSTSRTSAVCWWLPGTPAGSVPLPSTALRGREQQKIIE